MGSELKEIQPGHIVLEAVHRAVDHADDHLARRAHARGVEMPADDRAGLVRGTHVQMAVVFAVHRVHRAGQRHDLVRAGERERVVLVLVHVVHADGELVRRTERLNARQTDIFLFAQRAKLRRDLLAAVEARNDRISKTPLVHSLYLLCMGCICIIAARRA